MQPACILTPELKFRPVTTVARGRKATGSPYALDSSSLAAGAVSTTRWLRALIAPERPFCTILSRHLLLEVQPCAWVKP